MSDTAWTVALSGSGEVTVENAVALLDDWLPVEDVTLVFPKLDRRAKALRGVLAWAKEEDVAITTDSSDLIGELASAAIQEQQVYLVLAWDDTATSSALLENAKENGIEVKDLTRALDDLEFEDENAFGADINLPVETPEAEVVQAEAVGPATLAPQAVEHDHATDVQPLGSQLVGILRAIIREEIAVALTPEEKKTVAALVDEAGNYRQGGRGRPRKGETAVMLTPTEAREHGLELEE